MIGSLRGALQHKGLGVVVVDVGGVGYSVAVSMQTLADLPREGDEVFLLCHTHVREDALALYGFLSERERKVFGLLTAVSGVGPKLALTIMSGMPCDQLIDTICGGQSAKLQKIPGVGKKTSERLVLELKDRLRELVVERRAASGTEVDDDGGALSAAHEPLVDALVGLGYKRPMASRAIEQVLAEGGAELSPEECLRRALAVMREG
ncbi:MAG: Holliday junction branch migration protein RuvA [Deltaproteobacteria bacterium]|nr:Holliday junction branch migration protein RuvA [Deltaproteobacteria bacterium]